MVSGAVHHSFVWEPEAVNCLARSKNNFKTKKISLFFLFQQWELLVLSLLKWDLSTVTPLDFLQLLLSRLPIKSKRSADITMDKVRKHAQAFISLAARGKSSRFEFDFNPPSWIFFVDLKLSNQL